MTHHKRTLCSATLTVVSILTLLTLLSCSSGLAATIPMDAVGHSNDWMAAYVTEGYVLDSSLTVDPFAETPTRVLPKTGGDIWVTISPFTASLSGQKTDMVVGYLSGDRTGASITVTGKRSSDTDFSDIATIKPDENGLFIWAFPAGLKDADLFRVTATSGTTEVQSNAIRFTAGSEDPIIQPVVAPAKTLVTTPVRTQVQTITPISVQTHVQTVVPVPVQTQVPAPVPTATSGPSTPGMTSLTLSSSTTTIAVGQYFSVSGLLTDQNGNGIGGAIITIDEEGYSGSDHINTTTTGSDGSFSFSVGVAYAYTVGFVAKFPGDGSHNPATSAPLMITAY